MTARAFLGVGSSLFPEKNIPAGFALLLENPQVTIAGISTFYRTPPLPAPGTAGESVAGDPDFLNGVVELQTSLSPGALLERLTAIEDALGRVRGADKYAPRNLDLDLLFFEPRQDSISPPPPHRDIRTRPWVALPLLELAPELRLPPDGVPLRTVAGGFPGPGGKPETAFTEELRQRFLRESSGSAG